MVESMEFDDDVRSLEPFFGKALTIKATLVLRGTECYLATNKANLSSSGNIEVFSPGLESRLELVVPMWVGGPAAYLDTVEISGMLDRATTRGNLASLSCISKLVLFRDDEVYEVV